MPRMPRENALPARLFVDTGAWIALFSARDQYHAEADRLFRIALSRKVSLLTTSLVIAETHRFSLFHMGIRAALTAVERIEASRRVTIVFPGRAHHEDALRRLGRLAAVRLTYTDAVSFAVMQQTGCRVAFGFDTDFVAAGFSLWRPGARNP